MSPGEYAVHYSSFDEDARRTGPSCTILENLEDAEEYAKAQVISLEDASYQERGPAGGYGLPPTALRAHSVHW